MLGMHGGSNKFCWEKKIEGMNYGVYEMIHKSLGNVSLWTMYMWRSNSIMELWMGLESVCLKQIIICNNFVDFGELLS